MRSERRGNGNEIDIKNRLSKAFLPFYEKFLNNDRVRACLHNKPEPHERARMVSAAILPGQAETKKWLGSHGYSLEFANNPLLEINTFITSIAIRGTDAN